MKRNIKGYAIKLTSALFIAAAIMSVGTTVAKADEMDTQPTECVETVIEGQGDVIDDQFAVVEGQGDIIDDCFAVAPEEAQPATETVVEGQGDVIDDQFAVVEGQGDIIDDEFAVAPEAEEQPVVETVVDPFAGMIKINSEEDLYRVMTEHKSFNPIKDGVIDPISLFPVEGQGDVIDEEFAYVEGQGDVIDDQFAVTPEAEAAVEAVEVAENNTEVTAPSVNSFVAVGSADSLATVGGATSEENKSGLTETLEKINMPLNPLNTVYGKPICKEIDNCDVLGNDEKEMAKLFVKTGLGVADGVVLGDFIPGFGAMRKGTKMAENFSKALDAKTTTEEIAYTIEGVKNFGEAVVSAVPGGGLVVAAANVKMAIEGYCIKKVADFISWLF